VLDGKSVFVHALSNWAPNVYLLAAKSSLAS